MKLNPKRYSYPLILMLFIIVSCSKKITKVNLDSADDIMANAASRREKADRCNCEQADEYLPYKYGALFEDMRYIRLNFHFPNSSSKDHNFVKKDALTYIEGLLRNANERLSTTPKMNLPEGNNTEVFDPGYRYVLATDDTTYTKYAIYEDVDDALWYYIKAGKNRNDFDKSLIKKFARNEHNTLNVFAMCYHPDSLKNKNFKAGSAGIALGNSLKIAGVCEDGINGGWKLGSLFNHEVGHIFGLRHSWYKSDGCDDTPPHENCWNTSEDGPCAGTISNNMMDYNVSQSAITPCQISIMKSKMHSEKSPVRALVVKDWCELDEGKNLVVNDSLSINRAIDMKGNIIVNEGGTLRLSCRVHMPKGGKIIVNPGGKLILNGCTLYNDCGEEWSGIEIMSKGSIKGVIEYQGDVKIENLP